ncbi:MAG: type II toxin-antitoxin system Phd/YefM family antitoxin [Beijerinckiaceae bacterium]
MTVAVWKLQDAKARFSEVVRRAKSEGPQHVTVHGREEVVVVSASEFATMSKPRKDTRTGADLIEALSHLRGFKFERESVRSPIRPDVTFD